MFPKIAVRATAVFAVWGVAVLSWYYYDIQDISASEKSSQISPPKTPSHNPSTSNTTPTTSATVSKKTVVWRERNPYTKLIMEAVNDVIGPNEDWKVHDGCSDEIIKYVSIPLAVNTLTFTTAFLRYLAIVSLQAQGQFEIWYKQPHVQRVIHEVSEVAKHTINVYEL